MKYMESITDFTKSPKWMTNLLLAAVCCIIPFVGPMVVLGWLITGFWSRKDESPETFPDFDFGKFVVWLQRGLWPFLVAIVASIAVYILFLIPIVGAMVLMGWLLNGFWGRTDERAETFPDFSFDNFGKKLERTSFKAAFGRKRKTNIFF